jgi:methionyl aminopeptidase
MKIPVKTAKEIKIITQNGRKLANVLKKLLKKARPGVSLIKLEKEAQSLIKNQKAYPSFMKVPTYHWATCLNINEGVVHGIPNNYRLKKGDLLSIDLGLFYKGFHIDMARTLCVRDQKLKGKSQKSGEKEKFLRAGEEALRKATQAARPGNRIGHLSKAIEKELKKHRLAPVKSLTGHGIGRSLHEPPSIPCFLKGEVKNTPLLEAGMTLALEVIYVQGSPNLTVKKDGWTVVTKDGSWAGLFEDTILITKNKAKILTCL